MILGIGVDVIEPKRIAESIGRHGERFLERTFTAAEIAYCKGRKRADEHFAARWAAKEAVAKALGTGFDRDVGWQHIEVVKEDSGAAHIELHANARAVADRLGAERIHLSLSHTETIAVAMIVLEGQATPT